MRERDQLIQRRGRALIQLVASRLPQEFEMLGDGEAWPGAGVALLSRLTGTLGSILDLHVGMREADAAILARSLYEHSVHFAWLAADPSAARLKAWRQHDELMRVRADADARDHGIILSTADDAQIRAQLADLRGKELVLADLAVAADKYWAGRLPGLGTHREPQSFRGLYSTLYRHYSGMAHPTMRGLNRVTDHLAGNRRRIRLEEGYDGNGPYGMATVIFTFALYAAAESIGWPPADELNAVFDRYP